MLGVVVVGAGVIGLSTALHLLERFPGELEVTLVSDQFSPNTTSDKAAMIFLPIDFRAGQVIRNKDRDEEVKRWTRGTIQKFHSIYRSEENAKVEICLRQGYYLLETPLPDPWYTSDVFGFRHVALDSLEASLIHVPPTCVDVWSFGTYLVNSTSYLDWLMEKVKVGGAKLEQRKIANLDELSSYDIIINCTGIGSCELLGDRLMHPVRGQTVLVEAPWVNQWLIHFRQGSISYILPRARDVCLGGTCDAGNWNETLDPQTSKDIVSSCQKYVPSLCDGKVVGEWVGLRPLRDPIRLEAVQGPGDSLLIHCYGHGGQGVVLSWGSAMDIADIVQQKLLPK